MAVGANEQFPFHTRIIHNVMAIAVVVQLLTEMLMHAPRPDHGPNFWFYIHEISGTVALVFVLLFWGMIFTNRVEKPLKAFFPYFSKDGRKALWNDMKSFGAAIVKLKLPPYSDSELASAIEGLGLLLIAYMGLTGVTYGVLYNFFHVDFRQLHEVGEFHEAMGLFVWLYVIGHGGMGILHQVLQGVRLSRMWSFKK